MPPRRTTCASSGYMREGVLAEATSGGMRSVVEKGNLGGGAQGKKRAVVFFFDARKELEETRYLSNFYEAFFRMEGTNFPSVEHFFHWKKAKLFGDDEIAAEILKVSEGGSFCHPRKAKGLGRMVKNFDEELWFKERDNVMRAGLAAKFSDNEDLKNKLLATGNKILAEANPRDKYWGIGASFDCAGASTPPFPGRNRLGQLLEELREKFHKEEAESRRTSQSQKGDTLS